MKQNYEEFMEVKGTITTPKGFYADGVMAEIKSKRLDMGWIVSEVPCVAAGAYTTNRVKAAPLVLTEERVKQYNLLQAVVVNSGNANACTGTQGMDDAMEMTDLVAKKLLVSPELVAVASTGVIGQTLPMERVRNGITNLKVIKHDQGGERFAQAILTTDTCQKSKTVQAYIQGKLVTVSGVAKGSGMIHPNMATMLAFITTDANVGASYLQETISFVVNNSFNQITVDGDTSTNDMVLVLANGCAEHDVIEHADDEGATIFQEMVYDVALHLAKEIARDGEGATKLVEVCVAGARTKEEANIAAKQIVGSSLVKTAIYGHDANWGRIVSALGQSQIQFCLENVTVQIGSHLLLANGTPQSFSESDVTDYLKGDYVFIKVYLDEGAYEGRAWGCDLSYDYVRINASYRT